MTRDKRDLVAAAGSGADFQPGRTGAGEYYGYGPNVYYPAADSNGDSGEFYVNPRGWAVRFAPRDGGPAIEFGGFPDAGAAGAAVQTIADGLRRGPDERALADYPPAFRAAVDTAFRRVRGFNPAAD